MVAGQWYTAVIRVLLLESRSDHHSLSYIPSGAPPQVMRLYRELVINRRSRQGGKGGREEKRRGKWEGGEEEENRKKKSM